MVSRRDVLLVLLEKKVKLDISEVSFLLSLVLLDRFIFSYIMKIFPYYCDQTLIYLESKPRI